MEEAMFTGIIEEIGRIEGITAQGETTITVR